MPRAADQQVTLRPGDRCLIEAVVAERPDHDRGDVIAVRVGRQGYFQTFWIFRDLISPDPAAQGLSP